MRIGPTFVAECEAAGVLTLPFFWSDEGVVFGSDISDADRARVQAVIDAHDPTRQDMPALRQAAFETAMAYGNSITARITGTYSDVEARTWPLQRAQADTVLHGGELPEDALLRKLASRRGIELEAFALLVQHKAEAFETIADVGQGLRLGAEGLLVETIDTPEKLDAAFEDLRAQTLAAAAQLGLTV
jgi:hypothetical protein